MNNLLLIYLLIILNLIFLTTLIYSMISHKATRSIIQNISNKLSQILDRNSDEKMMIFTDDKAMIELITQINHMLEDRQLLNVEYRRGRQSSKQMLSNISHDIKTPLTVILGYLEIMSLNAKENIAMLKKVENKALQVMELINNFFTLSKIEAGDTHIDISRINIKEITKENIIDFYDILTEKNIYVDIDIPQEDIFVYGNIDALNRVFFNLISNAILYGHDGKYLGITLRFDENYVFIDIIDKGKGIEKALVSSVFDRLYTTDDSRNRQFGGSGLGLAITKSLLERLDGDILLESTPYVQTVFTVKLRKMNF